MKIWGACRECWTEEKGAPSLFVELTDHMYAVAQCENGHKTLLVYQTQIFQFLFDSGALAFADGYYRESVASFAASLERFDEFALRVLARRRGLADNAFAELWKHLGKQSERQLGAFAAAYLLEFNSAAPLLPQKQVEFRNDVIHRGSLPTREKAAAFADAVLSCIREALAELMGDALIEHVHAELVGAQQRALAAAPKNLGEPLGMGPMSFIEVDPRASVPSFAEGLERLLALRKQNFAG